MFKPFMLFAGGSPREAASAFFSGKGLEIPVMPPRKPQPPEQAVTLAMEMPRRKRVTPSRDTSRKVTPRKCPGFDDSCPNDAGADGGLCPRCRQRKCRANKKKAATR